MTLSTRLERLAIFVSVVRAAWDATMDDDVGEVIQHQADASGETTVKTLETLRNESDQHVVALGWTDVSPTHPRYEMRPQWTYLAIRQPTVELSPMWARHKSYKPAGPLGYILVAFGRDAITRLSA